MIHLNAAILSCGSVVGKKETEGPLGKLFDYQDPSDKFGQKTWEEAESEMQRMALAIALAKGEKKDADIGALFAGDLLNQCVGSAYGLLSYDIPYFGLYGACSTSAEGIILAAMGVSGGFFNTCAAVTSSHFCSAERQYRTPLEYGSQRPPTAQWTVTGSGAFLIGKQSEKERLADITGALPGKAACYGLNDANNMGAAMAPAAAETLTRFFKESGETPENYDWIVTGDLGFEGGTLLCDLLKAKGIELGKRYLDCGQMIYRRNEQDVHGGGSGCGCGASVLSAFFLPQLQSGKIKRMLYLATGAMMSPDSIKQGQKIPAIAHLLKLESPNF